MQCLLDWGLSTIHGAITSICKSLSKSLASWSCCGVEVVVRFRRLHSSYDMFRSWFSSGHQITSEVHPQLLSMVTSGPLGQFQLVFQAEDVAEVLDGALDQVESPIFLVCILSIQLAIYRNLQQAVPWSCLWVVWTWLQCQKSYSKTSIGSCLQMRQIWMASTCDLTAGSSCTSMTSAVNL